MPDEPILEELRGKLEEADWLAEEDRAKLTKMLGQFREICASMEADAGISAEDAAQRWEKLMTLWLNMLEACRKVEVAEGELLTKRADQADTMRTMTMMMLRMAHATKKALDEGTFTGTWEQRESLMEMVEQMEERRESLLEDLIMEDIRQLEADGVLYDR